MKEVTQWGSLCCAWCWRWSRDTLKSNLLQHQRTHIPITYLSSYLVLRQMHVHYHHFNLIHIHSVL